MLVLAALALPATAQLEVGGHSVELHGFASQGFAYSNDHNYLTMWTSKGSFDFTDAGFNISTRLTPQFRVGAQAYLRSIGELGRGQVKLDWALGDYRFADSFGVRAGKIKTVLGLYNDTQDVESLQTWAIMPQSIYPLDLRETSLSHTGADVYGRVPIPYSGSFAYTIYAGAIPNDRTGGYVYQLRPLGLNSSKLHGSVAGVDLKWTTPLSGLLVGASYLRSRLQDNGLRSQPLDAMATAYLWAPFQVTDEPDRRTVLSAQYSVYHFRLDAEYSRLLQNISSKGVYVGPDVPLPNLTFDRRGWYVGGAYRVIKRLEVGSYHSRFYPNDNRSYLGLTLPIAARRVVDQTFTARLDVSRHLDLKLEGHLIDGYGDTTFTSGFYQQQNPNWTQPKTHLFVARMGFSF